MINIIGEKCLKGTTIGSKLPTSRKEPNFKSGRKLPN
jgi:hypothetical protein